MPRRWRPPPCCGASCPAAGLPLLIVLLAALASLAGAQQQMLTHMPEEELLLAGMPAPPAPRRSVRELVGTGLLLGTVHVLSGPDHLSALLTLSGDRACRYAPAHAPLPPPARADPCLPASPPASHPFLPLCLWPC